jgi:hypothetical protein
MWFLGVTALGTADDNKLTLRDRSPSWRPKPSWARAPRRSFPDRVPDPSRKADAASGNAAGGSSRPSCIPRRPASAPLRNRSSVFHVPVSRSPPAPSLRWGRSMSSIVPCSRAGPIARSNSDWRGRRTRICLESPRDSARNTSSETASRAVDSAVEGSRWSPPPSHVSPFQRSASTVVRHDRLPERGDERPRRHAGPRRGSSVDDPAEVLHGRLPVTADADVYSADWPVLPSNELKLFQST